MNQVNWHHKNMACSAETCCSLEFGYLWSDICRAKFKFGAISESFRDEMIPVKYLFIHEMAVHRSWWEKVFLVLYKNIGVVPLSTNTLWGTLAISVTFSKQL